MGPAIPTVLFVSVLIVGLAVPAPTSGRQGAGAADAAASGGDRDGMPHLAESRNIQFDAPTARADASAAGTRPATQAGRRA